MGETSVVAVVVVVVVVVGVDVGGISSSMKLNMGISEPLFT